MKTVEVGNNITVHYKGTLLDGTEFDSSYSRNEPISFEVGSGRILKGFESATIGMSKGQSKTVTLLSEEAYGSWQSDVVQTVPRTAFPPDFSFTTGGSVQGTSPNGPFLAKVQSFNETEVVLDMNHFLAGEDLTFEIEVVEIQSNNTMSSAATTMLTGLKVAELRAVAKERGFKGYTKLKKAELLELLSV